MKTIETRVIDTLKPHPRNAALYGSEYGVYDDKLVASLKAGIWPGEIQVTRSNVIISGHRRCDHAIFAEIGEAEVWVRHDLPDDPAAPEVLEALLQGNLQRNKSKEQQLREFELWLEVEKPLAKARHGGHEINPGGKCRNREVGDSRDLAAKRVGLNHGATAEKALKALKAIILQIKSIQPGKILQTNEDVDYPAIPTMANRPLATYLRTELLGS